MATPPAPRRPAPGGDAPGLALASFSAEQLCASTGHMPAEATVHGAQAGCLCGGRRYRRVVLDADAA